MSFKKTFCPSPWFHIRINNGGNYEFCRWGKLSDESRVNFIHNIKNQSPVDYFQNTLAPLRQQMLNGQPIAECADCHTMEKHGKVSGRQRQLLKVGVMEPYFEKSLASSPMVSDFAYSDLNEGKTTRNVTDWQIDLGNYCNGACVFCTPRNSSRLAQDYKALGLIDELPPSSWCDNPVLLQKFINDLISSKNLAYLHFIGGETVITPGFKTILTALVNSGQSKDITVGFTTNLLVWSEPIINLLTQFKQVNLGLSIETLTPVNDYVRWPCEYNQTRIVLDRWVSEAKQRNWLTQLRITPTCLTIKDLHTVYDYAWEHGTAVESCNFLHQPEFLRINVLPKNILTQAKQNLSHWIDQHQIEINEQIINTRDPNMYQAQLLQDAQSYLAFIDSTEDESFRLPELIKYLKLLESKRNNSVLDYLPEYETLFRSAGY